MHLMFGVEFFDIRHAWFFPELAENYLNALRRRAGHTDRISLTLESVLKERRVEMAFEGKRFWDSGLPWR